MDNNNGNTTGLGLDGVVNQPNPGFGLPEEQVMEPVQPVGTVQPVQPTEPVQPVVSNNVGMGMPTNEELGEYNNQRAMAPNIDGPVQYAHEIETSRMEKANNLLDSLKTSDEREAYQAEQNELNANMAQVQTETILRNETAVEADIEKMQMQYVKHPKQPVRVENRALDPVLVEKIKKTAKNAAVAAAALGVTVGIVMGAHQALSQPEFVPEQTPQSIELQENIDNAENMNDMIDAINENKEQNIESGITTHPESVVETPVLPELVEQKREEKEQKEEKMQELREKAVENSNMSDSMQNFVDEVNRQKVIKIESGKTIHPETVINDSDAVGGRGL